MLITEIILFIIIFILCEVAMYLDKRKERRSEEETKRFVDHAV